MAGAFSLLSTEQLVGLGIAFGILTAAIIAMGIFGLAAAPGIAAVGAALIPLGFAMLMMGGAVGIAAAGMSLLVGSLITLKDGFPAAEFAFVYALRVTARFAGNKMTTPNFFRNSTFSGRLQAARIKMFGSACFNRATTSIHTNWRPG